MFASVRRFDREVLPPEQAKVAVNARKEVEKLEKEIKRLRGLKPAPGDLTEPFGESRRQASMHSAFERGRRLRVGVEEVPPHAELPVGRVENFHRVIRQLMPQHEASTKRQFLKGSSWQLSCVIEQRPWCMSVHLMNLC